MKKSKILLLAIATVFAMVAILSGCGSQKTTAPATGPKYKLKLATQLPDGHPIPQTVLLYAKKVNERSKGEIEITVFNNGALGQERDLVEGMKIGTVDMADVSSALMTSFAPRWQLFSLPYIFQSEEHMNAVVNGPIGQQLFKELESSGLKGLSYQWSGFRNITTKKGPINAPDDLKGLKIRTMPSKIMVDAVNAMGAIATPMDQGAVYSALQSGILDGWENNESTVLSFKMQEVCPYFSYTKHFSTPNILLMSQKSWAKLSPEAQKIIMEVAAEVQKDESEILHKSEKQIVENLIATGAKFNEVNTQPFFEKAKPLWKSLEDVVGKQTFVEIENLRTK